jgi:hypothetical protein
VTLLRLEADDPEVLELTGLALQCAQEVPDPSLRVACQRCGAQLGRGGDIPHGPLFTTGSADRCRHPAGPSHARA